MKNDNVKMNSQVVSEENSSNDHNQKLGKMTQESHQPLAGPNDHPNPVKLESIARNKRSCTKNESCEAEIEEAEGSTNDVKAAASCRSKNKKIMKDEDKIKERPSSTFKRISRPLYRSNDHNQKLGKITQESHQPLAGPNDHPNPVKLESIARNKRSCTKNESCEAEIEEAEGSTNDVKAAASCRSKNKKIMKDEDKIKERLSSTFKRISRPLYRSNDHNQKLGKITQESHQPLAGPNDHPNPVKLESIARNKRSCTKNESCEAEIEEAEGSTNDVKAAASCRSKNKKIMKDEDKIKERPSSTFKRISRPLYRSNDHNQKLGKMTQESHQPLAGPNDHPNPVKLESIARNKRSCTKNESCEAEIEEAEGSTNDVKAAASCRSKNKKIMKDEDKIKERPSSTFKRISRPLYRSNDHNQKLGKMTQESHQPLAGPNDHPNPVKLESIARNKRSCTKNESCEAEIEEAEGSTNDVKAAASCRSKNKKIMKDEDKIKERPSSTFKRISRPLYRSNDHNQELDEKPQESPQPLDGPNDYPNPANFKSIAPTESSPTKYKSCNAEIEEAEGESTNDVKAAASCRSKNKIMKDEGKVEEWLSTLEGFTGRKPLPRSVVSDVDPSYVPSAADQDRVELSDPSYAPSAADQDRVEQSDLQSDDSYDSYDEWLVHSYYGVDE